jgi:c(7)-type cytochrome triheme protein
VVVVLGFASGLFLLSPGAAQVKPTPDFTFTRGKDSPGTVTFSHEKHLAGSTCSSCHVKVFKMKKGTTGDITMAKMKEGQVCGACHNGKTEVAGKAVFAADDRTKCERCHKK